MSPPPHTLVVPRRRAAGLADLSADDAVAVMLMAQRVAARLRASTLACDGVNLVLADGEPAGQEVFHVHLHVVPRVVGDAFRFENDWRTADRAELDATAAVLRQVQQEQPAPYPRGTR